jgi:hypothetical protein
VNLFIFSIFQFFHTFYFVLQFSRPIFINLKKFTALMKMQKLCLKGIFLKIILLLLLNINNIFSCALMCSCVMNEPKHGELWCAVSKKVENAKLTTEDILPLVTANVTIP